MCMRESDDDDEKNKCIFDPKVYFHLSLSAELFNHVMEFYINIYRQWNSNDDEAATRRMRERNNNVYLVCLCVCYGAAARCSLLVCLCINLVTLRVFILEFMLLRFIFIQSALRSRNNWPDLIGAKECRSCERWDAETFPKFTTIRLDNSLHSSLES